jgi:hypothetical protein
LSTLPSTGYLQQIRVVDTRLLLAFSLLQTVEVYLLRAGSASSLVHAMGISSSAIPLMLPPNNLLAFKPGQWTGSELLESVGLQAGAALIH